MMLGLSGAGGGCACSLGAPLVDDSLSMAWRTSDSMMLARLRGCCVAPTPLSALVSLPVHDAGRVGIELVTCVASPPLPPEDAAAEICVMIDVGVGVTMETVRLVVLVDGLDSRAAESGTVLAGALLGQLTGQNGFVCKRGGGSW